ncbi:MULTISPECIES: cupin domain-containing protein [Pseudomonas]|uniref:Anti-sigma factor n=1 Tax=Pseudomonas quercus TaxID=2722792 RepID=A0ABX0YAQ2_9PSED|nr:MULTISPECIES: cupin domain-containing protein [Pseudomonas]MBF7140949.1 cupin domain-containing protein [Pseudomonas sp. LY10J]NJO99483.1 anti-sigma factor [Pseudomonas quercus]
MLVNADFTRPAVVAVEDYHWVASPQAGVERVMLDRVGAEKARATSIVRYAPGSVFPSHGHPGGEEILVLDGTFADDDGHYPAGWYLRNPSGSMHAPSSPKGAVIFVKLRQMREDDQLMVRLDTYDPANWRPGRDGSVCPLYSNDSEEVYLLRLKGEGSVFGNRSTQTEILIVAGEVFTNGHRFASGSWLRFPPGPPEQLQAGTQGATLYLRLGESIGVSQEASV